MKGSATRFSFILISLLLLGLVSASAQNINADSAAKTDPDPNILRDKRFSAELFFHLPYYYIHSYENQSSGKHIKNTFNYGGGVLISKYFGIIKLTTGFYLSTCNYYHELSLEKITLIDKISYWNIPITLSVKIWRFRPFLGVVITNPFNYNNAHNLKLQEEINMENYSPSPWSSGSTPNNSLNINYFCNTSLLVGLAYNQKLTGSLFLNIKFSYAYKANNDVYLGDKQGRCLFDEHSSIYFDLGLEYIFNNKK